MYLTKMFLRVTFLSFPERYRFSMEYFIAVAIRQLTIFYRDTILLSITLIMNAANKMSNLKKKLEFVIISTILTLKS